MIFILKHFDTDLVKFNASTDSRDFEVKILWVNEEQKSFLPLNLELSEKGIADWLKHRTIPKNRAFVNEFLAKCGLNLNRPLGIIQISKGLSLTDCYWVTEEGFEGKFADYNLFTNNFNEVLSLIAFTGFGSSIKSDFMSSPEFSTNGMLPKCWRRINGKTYLYKGGTSGASNTGCEPYSEFYAYDIASQLKLNAVQYTLENWKGQLCSVCPVFTSLDYSFVPVGNLIKSGGMEDAKAFYKSLGPEFEQALDQMLVFDGIICNTDRHFGNFGFLVNNSTNKIKKPAPLFDHGNSLFNLAGSFWNSKKELEEYIETLQPAAYDDFIGTAKKHLTPELKNRLRKLVDFKFNTNSAYSYSEERLILLQNEVRKRILEIIG